MTLPQASVPLRPRFVPPLDEEFRPAVIVNREFRRAVGGSQARLVIGLQRSDQQFSRFET